MDMKDLSKPQWLWIGQINAKFITTGTMDVSRIEGLANIINDYERRISEINLTLDGIRQQVSNTIEYKRKAEGITEIHLENAGNADILSFEVRGSKTYLSDLYARKNLHARGSIYPNQRGG